MKKVVVLLQQSNYYGERYRFSHSIQENIMYEMLPTILMSSQFRAEKNVPSDLTDFVFPLER